MNSLLLSFKPSNYVKWNPCFNICLNDTHILLETTCQYLAHTILSDLNDNECVRRQRRCFYWKANHDATALRSWFICREITFVDAILGKFVQLKHLVSIYQTQHYQMEMAYNYVFMRVVGYDRFCSTSKMFVEDRVDNFGARMRRLIYEFHERLNA